MQLINLTPHAIALSSATATRIIEPTFPPCRVITRLGPECDWIDDIPIHEPPRMVAISGLPDPSEGQILIVSQLAAMAIARTSERRDVVYPATGHAQGAQRAAGGVLSVTRLIRAR